MPKQSASHEEPLPVCRECGEAFEDYRAAVYKSIDGKRELFHHVCAGQLEGFSDWHVIIDPYYDDGMYRTPEPFEFSVHADSREGAIESALVGFLKNSPEIYKYKVIAFPESEWEEVQVRDIWGKKF